MKLHVQCDRCKKFAEAVEYGQHYGAGLPDGWWRIGKHDNQLNVAHEAIAILCGDCMPVVQKAAEAAIARRT